MLDCETNCYLRQENTTNLTKHVWTLKESLLAVNESCLLCVVKNKKQSTYLLWCHLVKPFGHLCFVNSARVKNRSTNYSIQVFVKTNQTNTFQCCFLQLTLTMSHPSLFSIFQANPYPLACIRYKGTRSQTH